MPNEEVPEPINLGTEKGIIKYAHNVDAVGCSIGIDNKPNKCIVQVLGDDNTHEIEDDFVVEPDFVQVEGLTQIPSSIASYSDPSYTYDDPPDDVVMLTDEVETTNCFVVRKDEQENFREDGPVGLACYPEGYPLETIDAGMTDEIYEDARELGIENY